MEGDTKRVKLEIVEDGPVLKYLTGELVPPGDIEQNWNVENQILLLLLQTGSFTDTPASEVLKKLEKLNNKWYQFIAKSQAWKVLFSKKYPEQFRYAIEKPEWFREVKAKLDAISVNPGREHTYWKRWYELLSSRNRVDSLVNYNSAYIERVLSDLRGRESLIQKKHLTSTSPKRAFHHVDKTRDVIIICFADIEPVFMLFINLLTTYKNVIPYDSTVLGEEIVQFKTLPRFDEVRFESLDGFMEFDLTSRFFVSRVLRKYPFVLVSSCQQCQVNDAQYVERNLRGLFCSEHCQREFRLK